LLGQSLSRTIGHLASLSRAMLADDLSLPFRARQLVYL
jgi:hypothetical protein